MKKQLSLALCALTAVSVVAIAQPRREGDRPGAQPRTGEDARQPNQDGTRRPDQAQPDPSQPGAAEGAPGAPQMGDMEAMMAAWQAAMTPGPAHEFLAQFEGRWRTTSRIFMDPQGEPMVSTGTARYRMIMDGRYLQQEFQGEMMGQPLRGMGIMGYDNLRKLYTASWLDNMGTAMSHSSGGISQDGKVITLFGTMDEPMTGEVGKTIRYLLTIQGPDRHLFEIQEAIYGEPFTVVEIQYEREAGAPAGNPPGNPPVAPGRPAGRDADQNPPRR